MDIMLRTKVALTEVLIQDLLNTYNLAREENDFPLAAAALQIRSDLVFSLTQRGVPLNKIHVGDITDIKED